jgi:DNA-directed RNA polymerase sigma subunit (sigma70/sigma32)
MVVAGHYGLDGRERTLRELGDHLGVSAERARQIERDALDKLRAVIGRPRPRRGRLTAVRPDLPPV